MNLDAKNLITISSQYGVEKEPILEQLKSYYSSLGIKTKLLSLEDFSINGIDPASIDNFILSKLEESLDQKNFSSESGPIIIVDAPTAFTLSPDALNIQLTACPQYMATHKTDSQYPNMSEEEIIASIQEHRKSINSQYHINVDNPDNYDAIIETDGVKPEQIVSLIHRCQNAKSTGKGIPQFWCHPGKFLPTQDVRQSEKPTFYDIMHNIEENGYAFNAPVEAVIVDGYYYVTDGHNRVGAACDAKCDLIAYDLIAKDDEKSPIISNSSASDYVKSNVGRCGSSLYYYYDHTWWKFDKFYDMRKWTEMMNRQKGKIDTVR